MTMAFQTISGPIYLQASSSHQLVEQLRELSCLGSTVSLATFMSLFASHFSTLTGGQQVRTDTPDNFVTDLVTHGWLKTVL